MISPAGLGLLDPYDKPAELGSDSWVRIVKVSNKVFPQGQVSNTKPLIEIC